MVLTVINIIALILLAVGYFRGNYTIVDLETWNKLAHFYNEYSDGEGGLEVPELSNNEGFFREYIDEEYIDEEEEPDEEEDE
jgi:hypothetical protein|nr:MAG TPA_asm: hypothetical protein [Caudoviricetes sp.]